jgi:hypothetical protein
MFAGGSESLFPGWVQPFLRVFIAMWAVGLALSWQGAKGIKGHFAQGCPYGRVYPRSRVNLHSPGS